MKQLELPHIPPNAAIREFVRRKLYGLEIRQAAREAKRREDREKWRSRKIGKQGKQTA